MKNQDLISIIVPVYNVENYLDRCVDSIVKQTYKNIEIILVDDGATDNSGKICDKWSKSDDRVKVFHKKNGGLSDARNYGIKNSTGKYLTFVDSDDYIDKEYVKYLYSLIKKDDYDISIAQQTIVTKNNKKESASLIKEVSYKKLEAIKHLLLEDSFTVSACAKLYKRELFDNIEFPKGKLYEDNGTMYKIFDNVEKVICSSRPVYYYVIRDSSITTQKFTQKKLDIIYLTDEMEKYLNKYFELSDIIFRRKVKVRLTILRQLATNNLSNSIFYKDIKKYFRKNIRKIISNKYISKKEKLVILIFLLNKNLFKFMCNYYTKKK